MGSRTTFLEVGVPAVGWAALQRLPGEERGWWRGGGGTWLGGSPAWLPLSCPRGWGLLPPPPPPHRSCFPPVPLHWSKQPGATSERDARLARTNLLGSARGKSVAPPRSPEGDRGERAAPAVQRSFSCPDGWGWVGCSCWLSLLQPRATLLRPRITCRQSETLPW